MFCFLEFKSHKIILNENFAMLSQSGMDALCSATYLEDYLDCLESLPDEIQRHVSEIRRLDSYYFHGSTKINELKDAMQRHFSPANNSETNVSNGDAHHTEESSSAGLFPQRRQERLAIFKQLKQLLLHSQRLSDLKLAELASIGEIIDSKTRELQNDSKNFELETTDNGVTTRAGNSNGESMPASHRPVRSIMRGFMRGEKERYSSNLNSPAQKSLEDGHYSIRTEKQFSSAVSIFTAINSEMESGSASPSTSSSANALVDGSNTGRQMNKRPRRQKQFPDFVRTELDTPINNNLSTNNAASASNVAVASSEAVLSPAPSSTNRGSREQSTGNSNAVQSNKRKKRGPQKPDASTSGSKIKFTVPVDPDEPTYCLCEQVSYGEMIGCDNNDCDIEWFHFNCVGLTSKPKGRWYCPNCRGDRANVMKQKLN